MQWFHFQTGWLNLWILTLVLFGTPPLINMVMGDRGKAALKRAIALPPMSTVERVFYMVVVLPQFALYPYTLFVPFTTNAALLCAGLVLSGLGLVLQIVKMWNFITAPPDTLITQGTYRISRNPDYFSATLMYLGLGLTGGSWLIVAVAIYWFIGYQWVAALEERFCAERWPEEFPEYKRNVTRNFLFF